MLAHWVELPFYSLPRGGCNRGLQYRGGFIFPVLI